MTQLMVGDKVRLREQMHPGFGVQLEYGKEYTVSGATKEPSIQYVTLQGHEYSWMASRFEKVEKPITVAKETCKCGAAKHSPSTGISCVCKEAKLTPAFDPKKPCQTRDGRKVRILATDMNAASGKTIVGLVTHPTAGTSVVTQWFPNGSWAGNDGSMDPNDLVNVPPKPVEQTTTVYLAKSKKGRVYCVVAGNIKPTRILGKATITIKEGDGL